jgi:hypothetical protein
MFFFLLAAGVLVNSLGDGGVLRLSGGLILLH